jgi:hypothetical protein
MHCKLRRSKLLALKYLELKSPNGNSIPDEGIRIERKGKAH